MQYTNQNIEVEWTGRYPNLCSGEWIIKINGKQIIDDDSGYDSFLSNNMQTYGTYEAWEFDESYNERFWRYKHGQHFKTWMQNKGKELHKLLKRNEITFDEKDMKLLYKKIQEKDWRHSSCGGCI